MQSLAAQFTTTTGTGDILLDGAARPNCRTIESAHSAGDIVRVTVLDSATGDSEVILGIVRASPARIERIETRLALGPNASGPTSPIDWQAGSKLVVEDVAAEDLRVQARVAGGVDFWWGAWMSPHVTATTGALPWTASAVTGGSVVLAPSTFGLVSFRCRTSATNANSGYQLQSGTGSDVGWRGGLLVRSAIRLDRSDARTWVGVTDATANIGAAFFFTGLDVVGRVGDGSPVSTSTTYTLSTGVDYVFEVEVLPDNTGARFRVFDALTDALLWSETLAATTPSLGTGVSARSQLIVPVNPGGAVEIGGIYNAFVGTRGGYLASITKHEAL